MTLSVGSYRAEICLGLERKATSDLIQCLKPTCKRKVALNDMADMAERWGGRKEKKSGRKRTEIARETVGVKVGRFIWRENGAVALKRLLHY